MSHVAIITESIRDMLTGRRCSCGSMFNPKKDGNGKVYISKEEVDSCDLKEFEFLKKLKLTEHVPVKHEN